jgi:hypothetical protein
LPDAEGAMAMVSVTSADGVASKECLQIFGAAWVTALQVRPAPAQQAGAIKLARELMAA